MLRALSGATHEVHTGVCVSDGVRTESFVDSCRVTFFPISEGEIDAYTATKEPYDKAGAYAIQGRAALWLDRLEGDYYTIMGLPVSRTAPSAEQILMRDTEKRPRRPKMKKLEKSLRKMLEKSAPCGYNKNVLFCDELPVGLSGRLCVFGIDPGKS